MATGNQAFNTVLTATPLDEAIRQCLDLLLPTIESRIKEALAHEAGERLLSPAETCKVFKPAITKQTLANWTTEGRLIMYRIGGRTFYKQSEIIAAAGTLKRYQKV